jgi:hypothetical protein
VKREVFQPPTSKTRKREPRRAAKSAKLLTREQRVQEAVKIINEHRRDHGSGGSCGDSVANMLDWLEWMGVGQATLRYNSSNETKRVAAWLHRGKILLKNLHGWPYGFESFREEVMRWAAVYVKLERPPQWEQLTTKTTAYKKRFAAEAALHLCDKFGVELTTTRRRSAFCRLAAVLYGDKDADLQKHCLKVIEPNYKTFLAREAPNRE